MLSPTDKLKALSKALNMVKIFEDSCFAIFQDGVDNCTLLLVCESDSQEIFSSSTVWESSGGEEHVIPWLYGTLVEVLLNLGFKNIEQNGSWSVWQ